MTTPQINLPAGFQLLANMDGSFTVQPPPATSAIGSAIAGLHDALSNGGAQIPTALAVPIAGAMAPTATESIINHGGDIASGNYAGAVMTGAPLLLGAISAAYAIFTKNQEPTNVQIQAYVSSLSNAQLIGLLGSNPGNAGAEATNNATAAGTTVQSVVQPVPTAV